MTSTVTADLTKVVFNPSKSVTFVPVAKKQMVNVEVTNNCTSDVAVKFKNTGPTIYKTNPPQAKIGVGEKKTFACIFKGLPREQCKTNDRFTVVFIAASKNVVIEKAWKNAHKTATLKHKISILFQGLNDTKEGETQPITGNEEEEDKDRQGQMRSKMKTTDSNKPQGKKATLVMFMRKELDSQSDDEDEKEEGTGANDDMQTVRPAGDFKNQVNPNAVPGALAAKDDMRTTRPAGEFKNQNAPNAAGGAAAPVSSKDDMQTTRPAGEFKNQTTTNSKEPVNANAAAAAAAAAANQKSDFKTVRPANEVKGIQAPNVKKSSIDLKTTKPAGKFENQQTRNN